MRSFSGESQPGLEQILRQVVQWIFPDAVFGTKALSLKTKTERRAAISWPEADNCVFVCRKAQMFLDVSHDTTARGLLQAFLSGFCAICQIAQPTGRKSQYLLCGYNCISYKNKTTPTVLRLRWFDREASPHGGSCHRR